MGVGLNRMTENIPTQRESSILKSLIINQKTTIFEKLEENKQYFQAAHPKLYEDLLVQQAKCRLQFLRSTFF